MTKNEKIYNKVAKEFDAHKYKVEDIFKSQFDFVAKQMSDRTENSILLPRIGTSLRCNFSFSVNGSKNVGFHTVSLISGCCRS